LLALPGAALWAQDKKLVQAYVAEGDVYWEKELYWEAAQQYTNACFRSPDNLYATYQLAECHRLLFNYPAAEKGYGKVYYAQSQAFPMALFYYALMQKLNGKYVKAIQSFTQFSQQANQPIANKEMALLEPRANKEKDGCEMALLQKMLLRRNFAFQGLGSPVNSASNDYAPIIADHDSALVITSGRTGAKGNMQDAKLGESLSDFFRFSAGKQSWQEFRADDQFETMNTKWSEGSGIFNRTHDAFYFASCLHDNGYCELYVTHLQHGKWQEPAKLNRNINLAGFDTRHPALTPGGDTLYFASNRPGGLGMNDLWMSIRAGGDNWGPPINLGKAINTPLNDLSPFYDATENLLFFASDGHKGLGGLDIFMVKLNEQHQPVLTNLGAPFNSNMDDCFFTMGKAVGYLSSNREGGLGNFDIYTFQIASKEAVLAILSQTTQLDLPDLAYLSLFNLDYLTQDEQLRADRLVNRKVTGKMYHTDLPLSADDGFFYQQLSSQEKTWIENAITNRLQQVSTTAIADSLQKDAFDYEHLSSEEQKRIDRMAAANRQAQLRESSLALLEEDSFFYDKLSYQEQKRLDRLVASRLASLAQGDASELSTLAKEAAFDYQKLPLEEQNRIIDTANRIKRRANSTGTRASNEDESELSNTFQMGRYHMVTLQGQLLKADTGLPSVGTEVILVNAKGTTVKTTNTNQEGHFQFAYLRPHTNYRILVNESQVRLTQVTQYRIDKLQMLGYDQEVADAIFENIYFDFNQSSLRPEARKVLDDLVKLCLQNPAMQVEINAFTDGVGSDTYNLELSRKRGITVLDYLMNNQVDATSLVMKAKGESKPTGADTDPIGRQVNRRIEFTLKGIPSSFRSLTQTCITPAITTVENAAKTFGMTVQELKDLNGLTTNIIEAYRPIRVRKAK
ncbi:MAG: OmpA family protein, partial [Bacteroidota bacterium]